MSRAIGISNATFIGARVAGQLTYVAAHKKNGKDINQRCIIPVYVNSNKGTGRDGTPGRSDQFRFVAWGKLADICARNLPKGKALDVICSPHSYEGRVYDGNGSPVLKSDGQPLTIEKVGFTVEKLVFGEESAKEVDLEVQSGKRPINWNVLNHPDAATYAATLKARQQVQYTGGDSFGYARVIVPAGQGITASNVAPVTAPVTTPGGVQVDPALMAAVQAALAGQPIQAPPTGVVPVAQTQAAVADVEVPF